MDIALENGIERCKTMSNFALDPILGCDDDMFGRFKGQSELKLAVKFTKLRSEDIHAMVKFVVSQDIQAILKEYNKTRNLSEGVDGYIDADSVSIEHIQLVHIASTLQSKADSANKSKYSLSNILKTTSLYIPPIEKPKPVCLHSYMLMSESRIPSENGRTSTALGREGVQRNDRECQT